MKVLRKRRCLWQRRSARLRLQIADLTSLAGADKPRPAQHIVRDFRDLKEYQNFSGVFKRINAAAG
jgi:hypothetical protein